MNKRHNKLLTHNSCVWCHRILFYFYTTKRIKICFYLRLKNHRGFLVFTQSKAIFCCADMDAKKPKMCPNRAIVGSPGFDVGEAEPLVQQIGPHEPSRKYILI